AGGARDAAPAPPEIPPGMTVRPADLAHGLGEGAVLEDAAQEMDAAVAHEELAAELEPDLRLHAGGDYALVSTLKCRLLPRSMKPGSGADGDIPSGRSARHGEGNGTTIEHTLRRSFDAIREGSRGRRRSDHPRGKRRRRAGSTPFRGHQLEGSDRGSRAHLHGLPTWSDPPLQLQRIR